MVRNIWMIFRSLTSTYSYLWFHVDDDKEKVDNQGEKSFFRQKTIAKKIRITLLRFSMSLLHKKAKDEFA